MQDKIKIENNSTPKLLIDPMIWYQDDGVPLIPGMDFYDGPFDSFDSMPAPAPLSMDYFIKVRPKNEPSQTSSQKVETHSITHIKDEEKQKIEHKISKTSDCSNSYDVKEKFLSLIRLVIIKDKYYLYFGHGYKQIDRDDVGRKIVELCRQHIKTKSPHFIDDVTDFIMKEPRVYHSEEDIPKNYISFNNGILDIETGQFKAHSPDYLTIYEIFANYNPSQNIQTPFFDKFLFDVTGGDNELINRIFEMIGYLLTCDNKGKCMFLLQGVPNSGKSVLVNFIISLFNIEAIMPLGIKDFSARFSTSSLIGKILCTVPDLPAAPLGDTEVSKLKQFSGNDRTSSDVKFGGQKDFTCMARIVLTSNHALLTKTSDSAFVYRIRVIPFKFAVDRQNQIFDLEEKLFEERDGIVSKAMEAYFRLKKNRYRFSGEYKLNEIVADMPSDNIDVPSSIFAFVRKNFEPKTDNIIFVDDAYRMFLDLFGSVSKNVFSEYFTRYSEEIFDAEKTRKRKTGTTNPISAVKGITLKL